MRSSVSSDISTPVVFNVTRHRRQFQLWNRQASIMMKLTALTRHHGWRWLPRIMSIEEVLKALERYTEASGESDRQTATEFGVNRSTLTGWLSGRDLPQRSMLERLAGFLRRVGYL
jgi:hypothetical protein